MITVAPSILGCNFLNIESEVNALKGIKNLWLHLDIMDGHFVPNLSFGQPIVKALSQMKSAPLDVHLMVTNPQDYIECFKDYKIHNITIHVENTIHIDRLISHAKKYFPSVGISFNPATPLQIVDPYIFQLVDLVLVMSVNPGFGGQKFISKVLDKIKQLDQIKKNNPKENNFMIQVDGGINENTAKECIKFGANNLVAGSFIFNAPSDEYSQKINSLR